MMTDDELSIKMQRDYYVVKNNELIQKSRYELSVPEQRFLAFVISKIKPTDRVLQEYQFSIREFCEVCGLSTAGGKTIREAMNYIAGLKNKQIDWMQLEDGSLAAVSWFNKVHINTHKGTVLVRLDDDIAEYLLEQYRSTYTQYQLFQILALKSAYSIRLYEILHSYLNLGKAVFKVENLKKMLVLENKYKNFADFRKNILDTATKEINRYTDINITWDVSEKNGKKVLAVRFEIQGKNLRERELAKLIVNSKLNKPEMKKKTNETSVEGQLSFENLDKE